MNDLTVRDSHFAFGENWRDFARIVDDARIGESDAGIARLLSGDDLRGKVVLDIGCGSGLPALSLLRAGAEHVRCVDIDPVSVDVTSATLAQHAPATAWSAEVGSVFDLSGRYDIVYSWGVLHHTGDMARAIAKAAALVKPGGLLCIAIYERTWLCDFWKIEKRFYSHAPKEAQAAIRAVFASWRAVLHLAVGRNPWIEPNRRGMSRRHDDHDWLGGFPYESASKDEVAALAGLDLIRYLPASANRVGLLGSGCSEYVFRA